MSAHIRPLHNDASLLPTIAVSTIAFGAVAWLVPPPMTLPLLSLVFAVLAAIAALAAWFGLGQRLTSVTYWDVSGALCLFSASAAIMGETEHLVAFLDTKTNH